MKKTIIVIAGSKGTGKSYLSNLIVNKFEQAEVFPFAKPIKDVTQALINTFKDKELSKSYEENKNAYRPILQAIGETFRNAYDKDFWVKENFRKIKYAFSVEEKLATNVAIIDDIRYLNEFELVEKFAKDNNYKLIKIRVERPSIYNDIDNHPSEVEWKSWKDYDYWFEEYNYDSQFEKLIKEVE